MDFDVDDCQRVITAALAEDLGNAGLAGDLTSAATIPPAARFHGVMRVRHDMVVAGLPVAELAFRRLCPEMVFEPLVEDGMSVAADTVLARLEGDALPLLAAERTALNLLQFLSGIATQTRTYVDQLRGTTCVLLDTRKTVPGLRLLSKYAARCGGASNHRLGLYDAILIKDNHIAVCGGVLMAVRRARAMGGKKVEVECDSLSQVEEALAEGVDHLLLDNMPPLLLRAAVALVAGRAKTEASGGVTLQTIREIAESGVDYISVGRITQSAPAVDIGLDWS
ncbi:MAG TPA: carboxylating nicotinate-nucleotide diphosphorylase [Terriglobales bacterium]|nr:carboxylating nicotinate-nucleotide diphosphorylase [Terriglobales bacterium]